MDYVPAAKILTKQSSSTHGPTNASGDGMSGYGLAVVNRPDRIDYSMTKGGLRLWITVALFIVLLSLFTTFTSIKVSQDDEESESAVPSSGEEHEEEDKLESAASPDNSDDDEEKSSSSLPDEEPESPAATDQEQQDRSDDSRDKEEERLLERLSQKVLQKAEQEKKPADAEVEQEKDSADTEAADVVEQQQQQDVKESTLEKLVKLVNVVRKKGRALVAELADDIPQQEKQEPPLDESSPTTTVRPPIKILRTKGKRQEDDDDAAAAEKIAAPTTTTTTSKPIKVLRTKGKRQDDEQAPPSFTPATTTTTTLKPVKFIRKKGKSSEDDGEKIVQTSTLETTDVQRTKSAESDSDQIKDRKSESAELAQQKIIKIKLKRTKGSSSEVMKVEQETVTPKSIAIKVHRTVGKVDTCDKNRLNCPPEKSTDRYYAKSAATSMRKDADKLRRDLKIKTIRTKGSVEEERLTTTTTTTAKKVQPEKAASKPQLNNREDEKIGHILDKAEILLHHERAEEALVEFDKLIRKHPNSPRAHYGKARALDMLSESQRSNRLLEDSMMEYDTVLHLDDIPDDLYLLAANRLISRLKFRGWLKTAIRTQEELIRRFPDDLNLLKEIGISRLSAGQMEKAKKIFEMILSQDPQNGHVSALYGFVLKNAADHGDLEEAAHYFRQGIESDDQQAQDSRFYFHLGDALQRLGRSDEAYEVYEKGAQKGLFLSKYQRSIYNVNGLKSRPWWTYKDTTHEKYLKMIEHEWTTIRDEGLALLNRENMAFEPEDEKLTNKGDWRQFTLFIRGKKIAKNCARAPKTCSLVEKFPAAATCSRGQVKFSVVRAGTHVWPHCGPTNCRIRAHLGLVVPPGPQIRVGNETRSWKKGKFIIFDDSFEHEVWYDDDDSSEKSSECGLKRDFRLVLIVDFWHPDLSKDQRADLYPI